MKTTVSDKIIANIMMLRLIRDGITRKDRNYPRLLRKSGAEEFTTHSTEAIRHEFEKLIKHPIDDEDYFFSYDEPLDLATTKIAKQPGIVRRGLWLSVKVEHGKVWWTFGVPVDNIKVNAFMLSIWRKFIRKFTGKLLTKMFRA